MGGTGRGDRRHIGRSEVCVLYGKYLLTADIYAASHLERDSVSSSSMLALKTVGSQDVSGCFSTGDYHNEMCGESFEEWFKSQLLPNIPPSSLIVMDNAPYHR